MRTLARVRVIRKGDVNEHARRPLIQVPSRECRCRLSDGKYCSGIELARWFGGKGERVGIYRFW
jgi:hypothetical protein